MVEFVLPYFIRYFPELIEDDPVSPFLQSAEIKKPGIDGTGNFFRRERITSLFVSFWLL
jgi:hypothetical protein